MVGDCSLQVLLHLVLVFCNECGSGYKTVLCHSRMNSSCTAGTVMQVRLVLEYCDKGSLRHALDSGAFMSGERQLHNIHCV